MLRILQEKAEQIVDDAEKLRYSSDRKLREMLQGAQNVFRRQDSGCEDFLSEALAIMVEVADRKVGLRPEYMKRYPHAFSGGERQRIGIARALSLDPRLVLCDEAVSALDVSVRAQILNLLEDLQNDLDLTYLFIAHDLSVVEYICDRVAVMYVGKLVELASTDELFAQPQHPYTEALLSAVPQPDPLLRDQKQRIKLEGEVADPAHPPGGCYFHPRCRYSDGASCVNETPELRETTPLHFVACHYAEKLSLRGVMETEVKG